MRAVVGYAASCWGVNVNEILEETATAVEITLDHPVAIITAGRARRGRLWEFRVLVLGATLQVTSREEGKLTANNSILGDKHGHMVFICVM
jgi:hypothetical protein